MSVPQITPRRLCPCCEQLVLPRNTPLTESDAESGYNLMRRRGWTAQRLLAERIDDIEYLAPGMTDWLRRQVTRERGGE